MIFNFLIATLAIFAASCPSKISNQGINGDKTDINEYNPRAIIYLGDLFQGDEDKNNAALEILHKNNRFFSSLLFEILFFNRVLKDIDAFGNSDNLSKLLREGELLKIANSQVYEEKLGAIFAFLILSLPHIVREANKSLAKATDNKIIADEVTVTEINEIIYEITKDDSLDLESLSDTSAIIELSQNIVDNFNNKRLKILLELLKLIPFNISSTDSLEETVSTFRTGLGGLALYTNVSTDRLIKIDLKEELGIT